MARSLVVWVRMSNCVAAKPLDPAACGGSGPPAKRVAASTSTGPQEVDVDRIGRKTLENEDVIRQLFHECLDTGFVVECHSFSLA